MLTKEQVAYLLEMGATRDEHVGLIASHEALRARVAELEAALRKAESDIGVCVSKHNEWRCDVGVYCDEALPAIKAALSGSPSALRDMLVEAAMEGVGTIGYGGGVEDREAAESIADRILRGGK